MTLSIRELRHHDRTAFYSLLPLTGVEELHRSYRPKSTLSFIQENGKALDLRAKLSKSNSLAVENLRFDGKKTPFQMVITVRTAPFEVCVRFPRHPGVWNRKEDFTNFFFELASPQFPAKETVIIHTLEDSLRKLSFRGTLGQTNLPSDQFTSLDVRGLFASARTDESEKIFIAWILNALSFEDNTLSVSFLKNTKVRIYNEVTFRAFKLISKDPGNESEIVRNLPLKAKINSAALALGIYNGALAGSVIF